MSTINVQSIIYLSMHLSSSTFIRPGFRESAFQPFAKEETAQQTSASHHQDLADIFGSEAESANKIGSPSVEETRSVAADTRRNFLAGSSHYGVAERNFGTQSGAEEEDSEGDEVVDIERIEDREEDREVVNQVKMPLIYFHVG